MFRGPNIPLILFVSLLGSTAALYVIGKGIYWVASAAPQFAKVTVIVLAAIAIFAIAAGLIFALWSMVFEALGKADSESAKILLKLIGDFDFQREVKQETSSTSSRLRGVGMLGTLVILFTAVGAIYFLIQLA
jgi:hypothetical protein